VTSIPCWRRRAQNPGLSSGSFDRLVRPRPLAGIIVLKVPGWSGAELQNHIIFGGYQRSFAHSRQEALYSFPERVTITRVLGTLPQESPRFDDVNTQRSGNTIRPNSVSCQSRYHSGAGGGNTSRGRYPSRRAVAPSPDPPRERGPSLSLDQ